jgi:molybdate transport system substrate-binding protein
MSNAVVTAALCCVALFAVGQTKPSASGSAKSNATRPAVGQLRVAAAADLAPALESIVAEFKKSQGADVKVTYGASGTLTTQIEQGAPFDVFMSADEGYPKRLIDKKLADGKTLTTYTRGRLVLYILPSIAADVTHVGLKALTNPALQKIAIANPDHAPYGRAAVAAMKKVGVYDEVKPKLVMAENVGQAAQFVRSSNVQAAIIALSAMNDRELRRHGRVVEVDMNDYPPLDQAAVVTKQGGKNPLAPVFVQFLKGQMAQGLFVRYGFMPPSTYKDEGGPMAPKKTEGKSDKSSSKKETNPKK